MKKTIDYAHSNNFQSWQSMGNQTETSHPSKANANKTTSSCGQGDKETFHFGRYAFLAGSYTLASPLHPPCPATLSVSRLWELRGMKLTGTTTAALVDSPIAIVAHIPRTKDAVEQPKGDPIRAMLAIGCTTVK